MTDQAQRTEWALQQFEGFIDICVTPFMQQQLLGSVETVRHAIRAIAPPMSNPVVGYAVFAERPDLKRESAFEYEPVSAVFEELREAENAHGYCLKRGSPSPGVRYVICAVQQIST